MSNKTLRGLSLALSLGFLAMLVYTVKDHVAPLLQEVEATIPPLLGWMLALLLGIGLGMALAALFTPRTRGKAGAAMSKSTAKLVSPDKIKQTFADVAGANEEKEDLMEVVAFLRNPLQFSAMGAKLPKGILLAGPPGTGKTLLARACAGEAGVPFYSLSGSDFVQMYVGVGAARVRDLFGTAKKNAPCIIFIDEIDAIGRKRDSGSGSGGQDEREQTLNQLLVEMDGFEGTDNIVILAATNRADTLDAALLRPGRFDRHIYVGYPDVVGREAILKIHSRNKPLAEDVDLAVVARTTSGFTGADLANLMNEAALGALRRGAEVITEEDIEEASLRIAIGPEKKSRVISPAARQLAAFHEAGHAVTAYYCPTSDPVQQITVIPRGQAGGFTMYRPLSETYYTTKSKMFESIVSMLGGRAVEELIFQDVSTGASDDIAKATEVARAMVTQYGFSDIIGPTAYSAASGRRGGTEYSESAATQIDEEVSRIIEEAYAKAKQILTDNKDQLYRVAEALIERSKLSGEEFKRLMAGETLAPPAISEGLSERTLSSLSPRRSSSLASNLRRAIPQPAEGEVLA